MSSHVLINAEARFALARDCAAMILARREVVARARAAVTAKLAAARAKQPISPGPQARG